jgi:Rad3-related DNA helicase
MLDLGRQQSPTHLRPDAWFAYRMASQVLVALLEVDRGTERLGGRRWEEKLTAYHALFASGRLKELIGYARARVLVVTPDAQRRDRLAEFILSRAESQLADRFWLTERSALVPEELGAEVWRKPGSGLLATLVPPECSLAFVPEAGTPGQNYASAEDIQQ